MFESSHFAISTQSGQNKRNRSKAIVHEPVGNSIKWNQYSCKKIERPIGKLLKQDCY